MTSAKDRAFDIVWQLMGRGFSRPMFEQISRDDGEIGEKVREFLRIVERGVEADRRAISSLHAPS